MTKDQERRIRTLIEEFKKFGNEGFVYMRYWVKEHGDYLLGSGLHLPKDSERTWELAAQANPCGTAACICGKAGLMEVFREEGFGWRYGQDEFTLSPVIFFGADIYEAVFCGDWAIENIHTPAQAVLIMEAFMDDYGRAIKLDSNTHFDTDWKPSPKVLEQITALKPTSKVFPVSHFREDLTEDDYTERFQLL